MKKYPVFIVCLLLALPVSAMDKVLERGWIGGEYLNAKKAWYVGEYSFIKNNVIKIPDTCPQKNAVFVFRIYQNTPSFNGGLKEGDLILKVNGALIKNIKHFRYLVSGMPDNIG